MKCIEYLRGEISASQKIIKKGIKDLMGHNENYGCEVIAQVEELQRLKQFIVMSPCYEILRYGHDKIKNQVTDAHTAGKLSKFVIGNHDLADPSKPPERGFHEAPFFDPVDGNPFRFEFNQFEAADIVIYVDKDRKDHVLKGDLDG